MTKRDDRPTPRVQIYFENPKVELALRREARAAKIPLSRAAEHAIARGLNRKPPGDPDDRLLAVETALRDHMRSTARDMGIVQEIIVEFARAFFARLPDAETDDDPLQRAAVEARIEKLLDAAAANLVGRKPRPPAAEGDHPVEAEPRSFNGGAHVA